MEEKIGPLKTKQNWCSPPHFCIRTRGKETSRWQNHEFSDQRQLFFKPELKCLKQPNLFFLSDGRISNKKKKKKKETRKLNVNVMANALTVTIPLSSQTQWPTASLFSPQRVKKWLHDNSLICSAGTARTEPHIIQNGEFTSHYFPLVSNGREMGNVTTRRPGHLVGSFLWLWQLIIVWKD